MHFLLSLSKNALLPVLFFFSSGGHYIYSNGNTATTFWFGVIRQQQQQQQQQQQRACARGASLKFGAAFTRVRIDFKSRSLLERAMGKQYT